MTKSGHTIHRTTEKKNTLLCKTSTKDKINTDDKKYVTKKSDTEKIIHRTVHTPKLGQQNSFGLTFCCTDGPTQIPTDLHIPQSVNTRVSPFL